MMIISSKCKIDKNKAREIGEKIGIDWNKIDINQFTMGINSELEHTVDPETKVISTLEQAGKIAWAHLKEIETYYTKLNKMEKS